MDDTARLVSELHDKLTELDGKVAAYQRDMLAEFHKHMVECLKKYPDHVSEEVTRVIAESMSAGRYPALSPSTRDVPDSPAIDRNAWDGRKSPPPILRHTSGTPKETARSPHAREKEFQGVFTPNYLPLLEKNARAYSSPPTSPPPTPRQPLDPLSIDNVKKLGETQQPAPAVNENRPGPSRRPTDRSTSSIDSSSSDSKALRRSALRRSSSSNKDSPRRVRFEFDGGEIFPASSSPKAAAAAALAVGSGAEQPQPEADTPAVATAQDDESTAYVGTSLLDVEGEEDMLPRPKKVSSTQALQALTRSPLEEGTVWTVVNAEAEELVKMNGIQPERAADVPPTKVDSQATIRAEEVEEEPGNGALGSPIEDMAVYNDDDDFEAASDEETLFMRPKKKTPSPTARDPFTRPPPINTTTTTTIINGTTDLDEDHDPFFDFDDDGGRPTSQSQKQPEKYHLPETEDDEDQQPTTSRRLRTLDREETAAAAAAAVAATGDTLASLAATKRPAVSPPSAALFGHSVGSYMGKTLAINPIKDPKLYEEIATMKDVHFFVGSIDGRSGVEAADLGSYRAASLAAAGGKNSNAAGAGAGFAPRSFTERLAMEEAMERRAAEEEAEEEEDDDI